MINSRNSPEKVEQQVLKGQLHPISEDYGILSVLTSEQLQTLNGERILGKGAQGLVVLCSYRGDSSEVS